MEIDWYEVYLLRTAPPSLDGGKSITRAIGRVGPENRDNLKKSASICEVHKIRLRYICKMYSIRRELTKLENRCGQNKQKFLLKAEMTGLVGEV